jgi:hypothetical protein
MNPQRRCFLQGAGGALLALPLLESNAATRMETAPKRLVAAGTFYGLMPHMFHPEKDGRDYVVPRLLKPLEHLRDEFTVFSGLDHNLGGGHDATKYFLSGIPVTHARGYDEANISVDQKAALHVYGATRYSSLTLGCETNSENYVSWTRNGSQVRPITSLTKLFKMLFGNPSKQDKNRSQRVMIDETSILDLVRDQANRFQIGLGKTDRQKLEQYFTAVRELERQTQQSRQWLEKAKPPTDAKLPVGIDGLTLRERIPFFYDLMTLALQTDSTRVITLSFSELGRERGGFAGVSDGYHALSHHGQVKDSIEQLAVIETFHMTQFARFLDKLKSIREPNGDTLLDNTMAMFGSGMSNANSHSNRDLPVLLAGGGFRHGEHKHYARDGRRSVPLCNLYLSMLQNFGLEVERFNTSTGTLTGLERA